MEPMIQSSARKAKRLDLAKKMTVDDAVALAFAECLKHWTANEIIALRGVDPEGIHEMRVGLRRMRSALSDFRGIIPAAQLAWMKRETKWLITSLGSARDWDVFLAELLEPVEAARPSDSGLTELRTAVGRERERGYATSREAIRSSRHSKFVKQMRRWLSAKLWRQRVGKGRKLLGEPIGKFASRVLDKRHKAAVKLGRDFTGLSPEERHQLRIGLKKLRYTAEFFLSLYPKTLAKPYFRALAQMQNYLGHMNDVVVAEHLVERLSTEHEHQRALPRLAIAAGVVVGWHARGASASAREIKANWRGFCDSDLFW